jgi:hypothetical protein
LTISVENDPKQTFIHSPALVVRHRRHHWVTEKLAKGDGSSATVRSGGAGFIARHGVTDKVIANAWLDPMKMSTRRSAILA